MFLSAVCDRTAKVQNFPDVTIGKSQNFPTLIYFSIYTYSTCHMEGTPTASTKTDKLSESCKRPMAIVCVFSLGGISWNSRIKSEIMLNIYASRARFAMLRGYIKK